MRRITDTFVLVAADCPAKVAEVPASRGSGPTVAVLQHELLIAAPYSLTHEDLIVWVHARRAGLSPAEADERAAEIRAELFAKPQACMRASPLPKRHGWGVHYDGQGRLALYAVESEAYRRFAVGGVAGVTVVPAMRNARER